MPIQAERDYMKELIPQEVIETKIYLIRGQKVMLSMDLAKLYGVPTMRLNEQANPYAFTEQGVAMLSSVLNSERAIHVNIAIMRAFVRLKAVLSTHKELAHKLDELEQKIERHDADIQSIFEAIRQLMAAPPDKARVITGFKRL